MKSFHLFQALTYRSGILLTFLGAISAMMIMFNRHQDHHSKTAVSIIHGYHPTDVHRIVIRRKHRRPLIFIKSKNGWKLGPDSPLYANKILINQLLTLPYDPHQDLGRPTDWKTYGLLKPQASIQYGKRTLGWGRLNPVNGKRYLRWHKQLFIAETMLSNLPTDDVLSWVSLHLLPQSAKIIQVQWGKKQNQWEKRLQKTPWEKAIATRLVRLKSTVSNHGWLDISLKKHKHFVFQIVRQGPILILKCKKTGIDYMFSPKTSKKLQDTILHPLHEKGD